MGSITALTNASGATVQTYSYDSFGNMTATGNISQPFTYTGREYDSETGMYFYRARYYDPKVGRFVTKDPIGFKGGINKYVYVGNNAVNGVDPLGLFSFGGGGYFGGGMDVSINMVHCCENKIKYRVTYVTVCGGAGIGVKGTLAFSASGVGVSSSTGCPCTRYYYKHENDFFVRGVNVQADSNGLSAGVDAGIYGVGTQWTFCSDTVLFKTEVGKCCE